VEKLRSRKVSRPLTFGSAIHNIAEAKAKRISPKKMIEEMKEKDFGKIFPEEKQAYLEILEDAELVMEDYFLHWKEDPITYVKHKGVLAEHEFEFPIDNDLVLTGKIDGIGETENGKRWLVEHKSGKNMMNRDDMWKNIQTSVYYRAMEALGFPQVSGTLWDYIRSKTPTRPSITQSGKVSKARIVTLTSVIKRMKDELTKDEYKQLFNMAKDQRKEYFARVYTPKKTKVIKSIYDDFVETAKEVRDHHGQVKAKTIDMHCQWCDYRDICSAEMTGSDVDFVKERNFVKDESHEEKAGSKEKGTRKKKGVRRKKAKVSTRKSSK
jgi:hypothetical protein